MTARLAVVHHQRADMLEGGREHFGFATGSRSRRSRACPRIGARAAARGCSAARLRLGGDEWRDVRVGEFVLGHEDEDGVVPGEGDPLLVNGTFMVWRKLEQHVDVFTRWIAAHAGDSEDAQDTLRAKILGRWPNGDSLIRPTRR